MVSLMRASMQGQRRVEKGHLGDLALGGKWHLGPKDAQPVLRRKSHGKLQAAGSVFQKWIPIVVRHPQQIQREQLVYHCNDLLLRAAGEMAMPVGLVQAQLEHALRTAPSQGQCQVGPPSPAHQLVHNAEDGAKILVAGRRRLHDLCLGARSPVTMSGPLVHGLQA